MSDSGPLLVPIEVQAMVLNNPAVNFVRAQVNYNNLLSCRSPLPEPFKQDEVDFARHIEKNHGVYLRWTLPAALRHGVQNAAGKLEFPLVPNRWLVVRIFRPATKALPPPATMPQVAAWIVQSDFLNSPDGSSYLDPTQSAPKQTQLGRKVPIAAATPWQEPTATTAYFLRAVADGNPAFSAYQPFNQNVFSIHDDLKKQAIGDGTVSYFVQGWYSDPKADVLAPPAGQPAKPLSDLLSSLRWSASKAGTEAKTIVCHGAAYGVAWQPDAPSPPPSPKDNARPRIAVGHTSIDAVVAFARAAFSTPGVTPPDGIGADQAAALLEAFQYNLLPLLSQPGGEDMLEQKIRSLWFGSAAAGTTWAIVDKPGQPSASPGDKLSATELAREAEWLSELNTAQRLFDSAMRDLMATQRTLFEIWWKQQNVNAILSEGGDYPQGVDDDRFSKALNPALPTSLVVQAASHLGKLAALAKEIPTTGPGTTLAEAIDKFGRDKQLPPTRILKPISRPRFWAPADPVMVLSGAAHLMKIESETVLPCRWPSEVITSLDVATGAGGPAFSIAASQLAALRPAIAFANLPAVTGALYAEFFLLDPVNAPLVGAAVGRTLTAAQLDALAASLATPKPTKDSGIAPAILAPFPWQQPWQPLYLDWKISWYPVPFLNANGAPNWKFNGTDYDLAPGVAQPIAGTLAGRAVLTPKPSFEFKARIDQFVTDNRGTTAAQQLESIKDLITTVDKWDFLSQAFSGLTTQVAWWSPVPTLLPPATPLAAGFRSMADLVGEQAKCPPNPQLPGGGRPGPAPTSAFEALRGGQFFFAQVSIVDVFGQTVEVITTQTSPQTTITVGKGMEVTQGVMKFNPGGLAQLPPRLLQPARLNFEFMPAANGNPIVGWILPNHVDGSLAVYGADGVLYGELALATNATGTPFVHYWPAPDTPYSSVAALAAAQPQLGGFLQGLQNGGPGPLRDFLHAIDETLWTVDPLGDRSDAFLSVLLGRPLAVVSAAMSFELQAEVWRDPAWPFTFTRPDPLLLKYQFPVQLGKLAYRHDGLIGYFLDGNYASFNAVHVPQPGPHDPPLSGYLAAIGNGNWVDLKFAAKGPGPARSLTLVMDPRASVHAQCGILPTKDVTLVREWVDSALAKMQATFRTGPVLAEQRGVVPKGQTTPVESLLLPTPGGARGTWTWRQLDGEGKWPSLPLGPVDGRAVFPTQPPILRDGVLQLTGGIDL